MQHKQKNQSAKFNLDEKILKPAEIKVRSPLWSLKKDSNNINIKLEYENKTEIIKFQKNPKEKLQTPKENSVNPLLNFSSVTGKS